MSLKIKGIFIPPDQAADLILLEQKNGGMSIKEGHVNAIP
jgi:hypothetical protein